MDRGTYLVRSQAICITSAAATADHVKEGLRLAIVPLWLHCGVLLTTLNLLWSH